MKVKLVGLRNGVSKSSGTVFTIGFFEYAQKNVTGVAVMESFLGNTVDVENLKVGAEYNAFFGRSGNNIELLQKA